MNFLCDTILFQDESNHSEHKIRAALLEYFSYKYATLLFLNDFLIVNIDVDECLHW